MATIIKKDSPASTGESPRFSLSSDSGARTAKLSTRASTKDRILVRSVNSIQGDG